MIQGEIDSNLDPGEYTLESRIIGSDTASSTTNFRVMELRNDFNILMLIIPSLLLLLAVWKFRKERKKKDNFRKKLKEQMKETEANKTHIENSIQESDTGTSTEEVESWQSEESELDEVDKFLEGEIKFESVGEPEQAKDISKQIKSGIENNQDPEKAKELRKSLKKSKTILADLELREKVPEIVADKEKQVMEELSDQNYKKANLLLDQIREILDKAEGTEKPEKEETKESEAEEPEDKSDDDEKIPDYSNLVKETVKEAKKKIREMEDPDYEKILEEEKKNKDRKTLKKFLNRKIE